MEISILSENEIEVYTTPDLKVKQRVITYKIDGFAPRTLWLDSTKIHDAAFQMTNPGKPVPPEVQAKGDLVRRKAVEADIEALKQAPQPRKI